MKIEREAILAGVRHDETNDAIDEGDAEGQEQLKVWRERLRQNKNWRSARVHVILDVIRRVRDIQPDAAILLVDESAYFMIWEFRGYLCALGCSLPDSVPFTAVNRPRVTHLSWFVSRSRLASADSSPSAQLDKSVHSTTVVIDCIQGRK